MNVIFPEIKTPIAILSMVYLYFKERCKVKSWLSNNFKTGGIVQVLTNIQTNTGFYDIDVSENECVL